MLTGGHIRRKMSNMIIINELHMKSRGVKLFIKLFFKRNMKFTPSFQYFSLFSSDSRVSEKGHLQLRNIEGRSCFFEDFIFRENKIRR